MSMSPFLKGALGFLGCAGICTAAYQIGKRVGREEVLQEVEVEEKQIKYIPAPQPVVIDQPDQTVIPLDQKSEEALSPDEPQPSVAERVRKKHGIKNRFLTSTGVIKDLLRNPDNKKITATVEDGDVVVRISQKEGG